MHNLLYLLEARMKAMRDSQQRETFCNRLQEFLDLHIPEVADLKEPLKVKSKGRPQSTKFLPTAIHWLRTSRQKKKPVAKREKAAKREAMDTGIAKPELTEIKLFVRSPPHGDESSERDKRRY